MHLALIHNPIAQPMANYTQNKGLQQNIVAVHPAQHQPVTIVAAVRAYPCVCHSCAPVLKLNNSQQHITAQGFQPTQLVD
jgi:hypothetical protein